MNGFCPNARCEACIAIGQRGVLSLAVYRTLSKLPLSTEGEGAWVNGAEGHAADLCNPVSD